MPNLPGGNPMWMSVAVSLPPTGTALAQFVSLARNLDSEPGLIGLRSTLSAGLSCSVRSQNPPKLLTTPERAEYNRRLRESHGRLRETASRHSPGALAW